MSFQDIFKKSFMEGFSGTELANSAIVMALVVTSLIGLYIFAVYRVAVRRSFYSKSFNISLVALAVITASVVLSIQSNIVISLGMVGALSIVRFRTAVKDSLDLVFLFWSIAVGIICGAGLFELAITASVVITVILLLLELLPVRKESLLLVVNAQDSSAENEVLDTVAAYTSSYHVRSRSLTGNGMDMIVELRVKNGGALVRDIAEIGNIYSVSLLSHDGEVTY